MPTYEYRCPFCQHDFEIFQRMSDDPVAACPNCGKDAVRKLSGGAGLVFKGSGFYITDYRSDSYKKAASEGSGGEGKSQGGDGEGKKDSGSPARTSEGSAPSASSGPSESKPSKSSKDD